MKYARINNNKELEILADPNPSEALIEEIVAEGYMPYECEQKPIGKGYRLAYRQEDGKIIGYYVRAHIDRIKELKIAEIMKHDISPAVNSFTIDGDEIWIPLDTRLGLVNQANSRNAVYEMQGIAEEDRVMTIRHPETGKPYTKTVAEVLIGMAMLEVYAGNCYNATADHVAAIKQIETIEELDAYDITANYPDKINL